MLFHSCDIMITRIVISSLFHIYYILHIYGFQDKKITFLSKKNREKKTTRRLADERNKFLSKYAELINNGKSKYIALTGCLELYPEFSNMEFPNDCEINLVLNGKNVYIALPTFTCDYTMQHLNDTYAKLCKEGKAPDSFYCEKSENFEPIVYGEDALENEYVFVSFIGMIKEKTEEEVKYTAYLIEEEIIDK